MTGGKPVRFELSSIGWRLDTRTLEARGANCNIRHGKAEDRIIQLALHKVAKDSLIVLVRIRKN